jgi:hypothetical protein
VGVVGRYNLNDSETGSSKVLQEITQIYSMDLSQCFGWKTLVELTTWETWKQRDGEYNSTIHPRETVHKGATYSHTDHGRIQQQTSVDTIMELWVSQMQKCHEHLSNYQLFKEDCMYELDTN